MKDFRVVQIGKTCAIAHEGKIIANCSSESEGYALQQTLLDPCSPFWGWSWHIKVNDRDFSYSGNLSHPVVMSHPDLKNVWSSHFYGIQTLLAYCQSEDEAWNTQLHIRGLYPGSEYVIWLNGQVMADSRQLKRLAGD